LTPPILQLAGLTDVTTEYEFSDSTILWGQYAQSLMVTERTLNAIQAEQFTGREPESSADLIRDHQDPELLARRLVIDGRQKKMAEILAEHQLQGMILSRPEHLSWITAGADLSPAMHLGRHPIIAYLSPTHRMMICDPTQSARLFEEELFGLGFLLKEFPLADGPQSILGNLVVGKSVAWDMRLDDRPSLRAALHSETQALSDAERTALRRLGRMLSLCVETTAATFKRGETERDIASQLVHRMIREGIQPVHIQVLAEERARHYRSAAPQNQAVRNWVVISATGRRDGLDVSLSRCVAFGMPQISQVRDFDVAAMAQTTGAFFTRPEESVGVIAPKVRRILEKNGFADEWGRESSLASAGRPVSELPSISLAPTMSIILSDSAWAWQVSVGSARVCDTIVTDSGGFEFITVSRHSSWPSMEIAVKGQTVRRPGFLRRDD
jgi:Xaa-Pro aminopeptidase